MANTFYVDADSKEKMEVDRTDGYVVLKLPGNFTIYFDAKSIDNFRTVRTLYIKMKWELEKKMSAKLTNFDDKVLFDILTSSP